MGESFVNAHTPDDHSATDLTSTIHLSSLRAVPDHKSDDFLELLKESDRDVVEGLDPESAMFVVLSGPNSGARYLLNQEVVSIGRETASAIFLDDITVSRKHCQITLGAAGVRTISDLNSLNGTYVNAIAISSSPLKTGDEVHVGKFRLTYFEANKGNK